MTYHTYSDPTPYNDPDLERFMIHGRIKMQQSMLCTYKQSGDHVRAATTREIIDQLLDRYNAADDLVALSQISDLSSIACGNKHSRG